MAQAQLDLRSLGDECGGPSLVALLAREASALPAGGSLEIWTQAADQTFTVTAWCRKNGFDVVSVDESGSQARILLIKRA